MTLSEAAILKEDWHVALVYARRAVDLDYEHASLTRLAKCQRRVGDYDDALQTYRDARATAPNDHKFIATGVAAVLADKGEAARAWTFVEPVLNRNPHDAKALRAGGRIQRLLGNLDEAERLLRTAAMHDKERRPVIPELRVLADQAREEGRPDLAEAVEQLIASLR